MYTNKVAVLAGDYLLARASVLLARLQHLQVVEVMASALDALVQVSEALARSIFRAVILKLSVMIEVLLPTCERKHYFRLDLN